jgi:hypothetical protein
MRSLLIKLGGEAARLYYFAEGLLPHRYLFAHQRRRLYGRLSYLDVLAFLHRTYPFRRYLEIGVDTGATLALSRAPWNCGVDPAFSIRCPLDGNFSLVRKTSDTFFRDYTGEKFDFVFVDGLHEAGQFSRDLFNALTHLTPNGLIALHDTVPFNRTVAAARRYTSIWTGDVYRALVPYIQACQDAVLTLLAPPTGLTLLKGPDAFLKTVKAPLAPSGLGYRECMALIARTSRRVDELPDLERVLATYYPAP